MYTFTNDSQSLAPFSGLICFLSALICLIKTLWRGNDSLEGCNFRNTAGRGEASPGDSCTVSSGHYGSSSHLALVWPGGPVSQTYMTLQSANPQPCTIRAQTPSGICMDINGFTECIGRMLDRVLFRPEPGVLTS